MCLFVLWTGEGVKIGDNVFFNNGTSIAAKEKIEIGDNCIFGENVKIYDHNHVFKDLQKPIMKQGFSTKSVHIGSNCWLGSNVVVLCGANIIGYFSKSKFSDTEIGKKSRSPSDGLRLLNRIRDDLRNIYSATVSFYRGLLLSIRTCCAASF